MRTSAGRRALGLGLVLGELLRRGDGAVGADDRRQRRRLVELPGDHQDRVVGRVELLVEGGRLGLGDRLDVLHRADHRPAVRVGLEGLPVHQLVEDPVDVVLDRRQALLGHDVAFVLDLLLAQVEVDHPIGLQHDGHVHLGGRDVVDVGGEVVIGHGVGAAADRVHLVVEGVGGGVLGLGEHQVLEQVRQAGLAGGRLLVARADAEPGRVADRRRPRIGQQHHLEAVVEPPLGHRQRPQRGAGDLGRRRRAGRRTGRLPREAAAVPRRAEVAAQPSSASAEIAAVDPGLSI